MNQHCTDCHVARRPPRVAPPAAMAARRRPDRRRRGRARARPFRRRRQQPAPAGAPGRRQSGRCAQRHALDIEVLTEWLAARLAIPYLRIDPLKVDVGRVADVMSIRYAERATRCRCRCGLTEVTIATCEPLDIAWVPEIEAHTRKRVRAGGGQPARHRSATRPSSTRWPRSVRAAIKTRRDVGAGQLRATGRARQEQQAARRQRPGRGAGGRLAVAVRLRPARLRHPPRAAARAGRDPLSHRRRDAHRLPDADSA